MDQSNPSICIGNLTFYLRNKSWKPECALSFNMDGRILVECVLSFNMGWWIKFTNICQLMLKLKAHSGLHDLFRF